MKRRSKRDGVETSMFWRSDGYFTDSKAFCKFSDSGDISWSNIKPPVVFNKEILFIPILYDGSMAGSRKRNSCNEGGN